MVAWMRHRIRSGPPYPPVNLLLVGNEENGEGEPFGTPHILDILGHDWGWSPQLMLDGERTGEQGIEHYGQVCLESRGVVRMQVVASGRRGHTGVASVPRDMADIVAEAKEAVGAAMRRHFTLSAGTSWKTQVRFPFMSVGEVGLYNITADQGILGVEVRPIPSDDSAGFIADVRQYCADNGLRCLVESAEGGVACPPDNPWLGQLLAAVAEVSGAPASIGKKLPGSSARFAPGGNAVIWGQSGIGPHSADECHFIPSIAPYLRVLDNLGERLLAAHSG
jgi:acetylornithine deacetylase/succinyl-diaminopimelate desuccinylase-like protein